MSDAIAGWMEHLFEVLGAVKELSPWVYTLDVLGGVASAISPCYVPVLTINHQGMAMNGCEFPDFCSSNASSNLRMALRTASPDKVSKYLLRAVPVDLSIGVCGGIPPMLTVEGAGGVPLTSVKVSVRLLNSILNL